ncbi:MAG: tripartite tricarboxylate transporter substrate binding protein, partial [Burkholderiales bacterium]
IAQAQSWPNKPITIIHGFAAGANPDLVSRAIAQALSEQLGQPVVIDMRQGAGGRIATGYVAKQPADGYTLAMLTGGDGVLAATAKDLPYDLLRDFAFVSTTTSFAFFLLVPGASPYRTLADLIDDAKKQPGKLAYGSSGIASTQHLAGELMREMSNMDLIHVPYKGTQVQEVAADRIALAISASSPAMPFIKSGKARLIATTGRERSIAFPDVPTVSETLAGYEVTSWLGLAAPAGTPQAIVERLSAEVRTALGRDDVKARIANLGADPFAMTSAAFRARVESDIAKWRRLAQNVKLD